MEITKKLWKKNHEIALLCLNTKFVKGIKNGDLPKNIFKEYISQDYFFLESFAKAYGMAVFKSKDKYTIKTLSKLLNGVSEELILHEKYAREWKIELLNNSIKAATKQYTDFLYEVSQKYSTFEIMLAMAPCMRLYSWIGKSLSNFEYDDKYREWITTYSDKNFENLAVSLETLINKSEDSNDVEKGNYLYKRAMELELDFFNAYSNF